MADKLIIQVDLQPGIDKSSGKSVEADAKKVGSKAGKKFDEGFSKEANDSVINLGSAFKKLGAIAVGIGIAKVFTGSIAAANKQEDAVNRLNVALQITGKYTAATSASLQKYASSLQVITRYGDEAILETQALIQSLGNLDEKGLKRATAATLDLASALKIDLNSAATLVGKAAAGEVGSFGRYGVSIKKASTKAETFTNALDALEKKFGGTAAKQVNTFSGATDQLSNAIGDVSEGFGQFLTQNPLVIAGIKGLTSVSLTFADSLKNVGREFNGAFGAKPKTDLDQLNVKFNDVSGKIREIRKTLKAQEEGGFFDKLLRGGGDLGADGIANLKKR